MGLRQTVPVGSQRSNQCILCSLILGCGSNCYQMLHKDVFVGQAQAQTHLPTAGQLSIA